MREPTCAEEEFGPIDPKYCDGCQETHDNCSCRCDYMGCEDGYFYGEDTPGFDYINDDPNEIYPCPSCGGTGLARNRRLW